MTGFRDGGRGIFDGAPTFTLRNRMERLCFNLVWLMLARWTPPQMRRWRAALLRAFGGQIGSGVMIYASVRIWHPANLRIKDGAVVGPGVRLYSMDRITIGQRAVVSQRAHLCTGSHDLGSAGFELRTRPVVIGPYAWICAEAFVGPGVSMGEGAVLAARGAAFRDLAPWTVHSGNPASKVKTRQNFMAAADDSPQELPED